jgi:hypothetical protein
MGGARMAVGRNPTGAAAALSQPAKPNAPAAGKKK